MHRLFFIAQISEQQSKQNSEADDLLEGSHEVEPKRNEAIRPRSVPLRSAHHLER